MSGFGGGWDFKMTTSSQVLLSDSGIAIFVNFSSAASTTYNRLWSSRIKVKVELTKLRDFKILFLNVHLFGLQARLSWKVMFGYYSGGRCWSSKAGHWSISFLAL